MAFNGTEGAPIPLATAGAYTATYRATLPVGSTATIGTFFGKDILNQLLAQGGAMGIRFYFAIDGSGTQTLVAVAADAAENDMVNGIVADVSTPCPPFCSTSNVLNS